MICDSSEVDVGKMSPDCKRIADMGVRRAVVVIIGNAKISRSSEVRLKRPAA